MRGAACTIGLGCQCCCCLLQGHGAPAIKIPKNDAANATMVITATYHNYREVERPALPLSPEKAVMFRGAYYVGGPAVPSEVLDAIAADEAFTKDKKPLSLSYFGNLSCEPPVACCGAVLLAASGGRGRGRAQGIAGAIPFSRVRGRTPLGLAQGFTRRLLRQKEPVGHGADDYGQHGREEPDVRYDDDDRRKGPRGADGARARAPGRARPCAPRGGVRSAAIPFPRCLPRPPTVHNDNLPVHITPSAKRHAL